MEFLIFVFILISILSSLTSKTRKNRKKETLFDPWSFEEDLPEDKPKKVQNIRKIWEVEPESRDILIDERESEIKQVEEQEDVLEDILPPYEVEESIWYSEQEQKEKKLTEPYFSSGVEKEKEKDLKIDSVSFNLEKELSSLLVGNKLPLAILISEILSPPKSFILTRRRFPERLTKNQIQKER